jgi:hypothetical protein
MTSKENPVRPFNSEVNPSEEHRKIAFDPFFKNVLYDANDANCDLYKKTSRTPSSAVLRSSCSRG